MTTDGRYLLQAALEVQRFFEENHWQFALVGGLATLRWGEPRTTVDVDGTLLTMFTDDELYIDRLLARFVSRVPDAKTFALQYRVLLLAASNGVALDISLGGLPFERQLIERSSLFEYEENYILRTCSAEDLIVLKAFAARDKDWADVLSVIQRQKGRLDTDYICENLAPLCELKGDPEIMPKLDRMLKTAKD